MSYALTRERLRVLSTPAGEDPREYYAAIISNEPDATLGASLRAGARADDVRPGREGRADFPAPARCGSDRHAVSHRARSGAAAGQARATARSRRCKRARELFPRNVAVTVRYAESLMQLGDSKRAHEILLDLFNVVPPTPEQARLTALAANAAGDVADSYFYMSEYHLMSGDLPLAINQLQLALAVPKIYGRAARALPGPPR